MRSTLRLARALAVGSPLLLSLYGCAQIIGLDDYTVASRAGKAGASGESGASGDEAGQAGQAGELPPIVGCDGSTEFTPNEQVVRSCILRAGCDPNFYPVRNISTCVTKDTQRALSGESCNLDSTTCADYEACEHVGVAHEDLCGTTRCQGDLAVNCGNYKTGDRFTDCAALGGHCGTYTYSVNSLLYADCTYDVSPQTCDGASDSDTLNYCSEQEGQPDVRYYCYDGQAFGSSCSVSAKCVDSPEMGDATCYFNTQSCSGPKVPTCANDTATVCSSGNLFNYNCGKVGLSCAIDGTQEYCVAPGCKAADVDNCTESCSEDGAQLTFCYGGVPYTVTCSDYGFSQCLSDKDDNDQPFAACRY